MTVVDKGQRIAVLTRGVTGGGVQRRMLTLAETLVEQGYQVDLLVRARKHHRSNDDIVGDVSALPSGVRLIRLSPGSRLQAHWQLVRMDPRGVGVLLRPVLMPLAPSSVTLYLPALVHYLREDNPDGLVAATTYLNLIAVWAVRATGLECRVLLSERDDLSHLVSRDGKRNKWRWRYVGHVIQRYYPWANAIVAVSRGVRTALTEVSGLSESQVEVVDNPVIDRHFNTQAEMHVEHPWLIGEKRIPVIVAAGRLVAKKDFGTLLEAMKLLRQRREVRLLLLGEGPERNALEQQRERLGLADCVDMPGFVTHPVALFRRASLFVLSSQREGLPGVLIEAMACGCPVVSTDCPSGPAEILENGRLGRLVPPGDAQALAEACADTLAAPLPAEQLIAHTRHFTAERTTQRYLALLGLSD
ncbi:glycosyltransferase [Kushneria phosphatilytica]|uniref:Glycosyltransferase n=1 Tax=Kushneria phosphatilytica TaxID=657387 RepID=A0A1S1NRM2_9GAMM|nr:glycosyltransferase [Kushneria phosphatilytica]OHV07742.1 hypothetical protein BH688_16300 [Kushneria phosphatilytica]QEL10245.1 glycosyltransferase [Kushneria phosphatilytica]